MCLILHEGLYHSGGKSRNLPEILEDIRFFAYIWPLILDNDRNRNVGRTDGVARELGDEVYRDGIHHKIYTNLYKNNEACEHCRKDEVVIDLSKIADTSFQSGERIIGNM